MIGLNTETFRVICQSSCGILITMACPFRFWKGALWVWSRPHYGTCRSGHGNGSSLEKGWHHQYRQRSNHLFSWHSTHGGAPSRGQKLLGGYRLWVSVSMQFSIFYRVMYFRQILSHNLGPKMENGGVGGGYREFSPFHNQWNGRNNNFQS